MVAGVRVFLASFGYSLCVARGQFRALFAVGRPDSQCGTQFTSVAVGCWIRSSLARSFRRDQGHRPIEYSLRLDCNRVTPMDTDAGKQLQWVGLVIGYLRTSPCFHLVESFIWSLSEISLGLRHPRLPDGVGLLWVELASGVAKRRKLFTGVGPVGNRRSGLPGPHTHHFECAVQFLWVFPSAIGGVFLHPSGDDRGGTAYSRKLTDQLAFTCINFSRDANGWQQADWGQFVLL